MGYKSGINKQQLFLMPMCIDDNIPQDHICRVISAFTEQIDIVDLGFKYSRCNSIGSPPYNPRVMLNLYIYGYMHRIRSSRRLQAETGRNMEVIWLMNGLTPDDRTICNFRKDNAKALREVFCSFNKMCRLLGLFGGDVAAIDGSKFRANNSRKNNHNKVTVERELSRLEKQIDEYLHELDIADTQEEGDISPTAEQIKEALKKLEERKIKFEALNERLKDENDICTIDPDARLMKQGGDSRVLDVCYNVQTVVDSKHHLIADFDITDRSDDKGNLQNMSERAKEVMAVESITIMADKGYYDGQDIVNCEENGVVCLVAKPKPGGATKEKGFTIEEFIYDRENDCYICPSSNRLSFMRIQKHNNGKEYQVYANYSACNKCLQKPFCTKSRYRQILRLPYQNTLDAVHERLLKNKSLYRKRQEIVEHPFGTIKVIWGFKNFLCRTKQKITAETAMACLAYNFRRVINIFKDNTVELIAALAR